MNDQNDGWVTISIELHTSTDQTSKWYCNGKKENENKLTNKTKFNNNFFVVWQNAPKRMKKQNRREKNIKTIPFDLNEFKRFVTFKGAFQSDYIFFRAMALFRPDFHLNPISFRLQSSTHQMHKSFNKSHIAAHLPHTHVFLFCIETNTILCAL